MKLWKIAFLCVANQAQHLVLATPASANGASSCQQHDVLILGAGMAGVQAGKTLTDHGVHDFVILENNDWIGGRVFHKNFGTKADGSPWVIEQGANWVQGLHHKGGPVNPIRTLTKRSNIVQHISDFDNITLYDQNGAAHYRPLFNRFFDAYDKVAADAGYILDDNLLDRSARAGFSLSDWHPGTHQYKQAVEWYEWDWEQIFPPDTSSELFGFVSMNATFEVYSEENLFVVDQRGYNTFIKDQAYTYLSKHDPRLHLSTTVSKVAYGNNSVTVTTSKGQCFTGKHAIATFSLGVLKAAQAGTAPVKFSPPFPRWKNEAIVSFGMGIYTKIFLQFEPEQQFWPDNVQFMLYADPATRGYYASGQSLTAPGFLPESGIFIVTVVGDQSLRVEAQSDAETKAEVLQVLRNMFGKNKVPEPKAFFYPRFTHLNWTYGSYSNWQTGVTLQQHQNLRANLDNLWFAGEATSSEYFGYLQGAYYEGELVAQQVARCLNSTTCTNSARYTSLKGLTAPRKYDKVNGWQVDTNPPA